MKLSAYNFVFLLSVFPQIHCFSTDSLCPATTCADCVTSYSLFGSCRWCPKTGTCHSSWSFGDCTEGATSNKAECSNEKDITSLSYNEALAYQMVLWCSVSYVMPETKDPESLIRVIRQNIGVEYEAIEFITGDCDRIFDYGRCGVVVAISRQAKQVVVAYRGTTSRLQLIEEFAYGLVTLTDFPAGGMVLRYVKSAHDVLYDCLTSYLTENLTVKERFGFAFYVTGHSLGAGLAQLSAISLVKDGVVSSDRLSVMTFGGFKAGNKPFADSFDKAIPASWRVVHDDDPVPQLPPKSDLSDLDATHTSNEIYYPNRDMKRGDKYITCKSNADSRCFVSYGLATCFYSTCVDRHLHYFIQVDKYISTRIATGQSYPTTDIDENNKNTSCVNYRYLIEE